MQIINSQWSIVLVLSHPFGPGAGLGAAGSHDREAVKLWETATWQEVLTLAGEGAQFNMVAFSPDGRTLMAANRDGLVHIWTAPCAEGVPSTTLKAGPPSNRGQDARDTAIEKAETPSSRTQ